MKPKTTYHEEAAIKNTRKLREVLTTLPGFARDYFRALEITTLAKTRISYAYDIRVFFCFLKEENVYYKNKEIRDISLADLEYLKSVDIEEYLEYLKYYTDKDGKTHTNGERGIHRKLAALRSFFSYYHKRELIQLPLWICQGCMKKKSSVWIMTKWRCCLIM